MTSPQSVDKGLADHLVGNALGLSVLVDESSNKHGGKSGGTDGSIHAEIGVRGLLLLCELCGESHSETVLKPVLNIVSRLFNLELECLVNHLKFTLVGLVHHTHLLPEWSSVVDVIFPCSLVRG